MSHYKVIYRIQKPKGLLPFALCVHTSSLLIQPFLHNRHTHHDITVAIGRIYALRTCDAA